MSLNGTENFKTEFSTTGINTNLESSNTDSKQEKKNMFENLFSFVSVDKLTKGFNEKVDTCKEECIKNDWGYTGRVNYDSWNQIELIC